MDKHADVDYPNLKYGNNKTSIAKCMNMHVEGAMITKFLLSLYTKLKGKNRTDNKNSY